MTNDLMKGPLGVRKVSERIVKEGRALIVTDKNAAKWEDIPFGAIRVDPYTNEIYIKSYDNENDWTLLEFGTYVPSNPGEVDAWTPGVTIPLGGLTEAQVNEYLNFYEGRIKEIEEILVGFTTIWQTFNNRSDRARQMRTKLIDIYEGIYTGSSTAFEALAAKDMSQVFNAIKTGIDIVIEIISGLLFNNLDLVRLQLNELYEIIYPSVFIVNEFATADELAANAADLYRIIGIEVPGSLSPSYINSITDDEIGELISEHLREIEIIYARTQEGGEATVARMMAYTSVEEPVDTEKDVLLERIRMLEDQVSLLVDK